MAKKWSDVAASSAFQALSYEEQEEARRQYFEEIVAPRVPTEDIDLVRGQFLADTTIKRPQPVDNTQIDYGDASTSMLGTPPPANNRGLIARLSDALKPAPKPSVMEGFQPTQEQRQAAIDQRLSYGAGPISQQTVQRAADVRAGARTTDPVVARVAKSMQQQNTPTLEGMVARTNNPVVQEMVRDEKADEFRSAGEWAIDTLSGLSQGVVSLAQLPINIIAPSSEIAETLRQTQKEWQAAESDVLKAQREQLRQRVQQEDGFLDKYAATVVQLVTSPALTISEAAKQVPMFLGVLGASRLGAAAAGTGVNVAGRVSPTVALSDAISGGAIQAGARAAGSTAGGVGASMVMAGGDAAGGVYEKLTDPKQTPMSVWEKNEDFQRLTAEGKTADQAIEEIATTKARMAAMITAPLGLLGFAGAEAAIASRGLGKATRDALTFGGAGKLVAKDLAGEQLEEGGTQFGGNVIARTVNPNVKLTEGVPEAMGQALVTAAPFSVLGATSQYQQARQQAQDRSLIADALAIESLRTDPGTSNFIRPGATVANFTPSGSPTQRAGMVDIVIPVPDAPIAVGGLDVSTAGSPSGALAGSAGRESSVAVGGVDVAGRDLDSATGVPGGAIGGVRTGDRQDDALRVGLPERPANLTGTSPIPRASDADLLARTEAAISENNNAVVQPAQQWFGRKGDGYANEADAGQALPGRQRMFPTLDWKVEQMPSGKYRLAGYSQETNLGAQAPQAIQSQTQGQQATQVADATQGVVSTGETPAGATLELSGAERAGLKLALPAPASTLGAVKTALAKQRGVEVDAIPVAELNDSQRVASAVGRLLGRTVTFVRAVKGDAQQVPNGMVNRLGGKHIFVASNTDDAPLTVTMHEAYHGLPAARRKQLNTALLETFASDRKADFQTEFGYDDAKFEEEAPAMIAQAVSKRADFWEELRTKMGNKEFGEVAKVILDKLTQIVTGAKKEYGDAFVSKYIKDVDRARSLLTDAYAEAMKAQGKQPEVDGVEIAASERSMNDRLQQRIDEDFDAAVAEYSALPEADGGKLIDTDLVRELSPEYRADRTRAAEVHDAASDMTQRMFEARVDAAEPGNVIAFMAGGGGAGKSTAQGLLKAQLSRAHTILDGTLSSYDKARRNVQRALDRGHAVQIMYVYREPEEALRNGVLTRAMSKRRAVPLDALVKGHAGSSEVVRRLEAEFGGNPRFKVYAIDNSRGAGKAALVPLQSITPVIKSGLKERLLNATETEYQAGRIDDQIYRATLEGFPDAGAGAEAQAQDGGDRQGDQGSVQERTGSVGSRDAVDEPAMSERAGEYRYEKDEKGRITFNKDVERVRFLARDVKPSKVDSNSITFKAEDAAKVIKALETEPKVDNSIAASIKKSLKLTNKELASTSLEYQTGEPKDRAFVAPLKGGIPEVVKFLEDRRRASGLRLLDVANLEDQDIVAKLMAAETLAAIRSAGNALEWYDETIARTLAMAAVKYPELQSDRNAQMIFRLAMAITSQGLNVENNLKFTMRQYDAYRRTGKYPEVGEGDSAQAMTGNFKLANELMAEMGVDLFRRFLVTPFTIGELNAAGFEPGGELIDETVLGSSVFGPKIGFGFYSNLNGNFEPVTMDMWFMRTIGRLTGNLRAFDAEKFGGQLARLREALTQTGDDGVFADQFDPDLVERAATDQDAAIELARQVTRAHEKDFKVNRAAFDAKTRKKSQLVLAADTMIQSLDKPRDVPASGGERRLLREVVRKAVAQVEKAYGQRIPPAAMQALIWYPEQELYKAMGVKLSVTSQDYAGATEKVLKEEGYDEQRLRAAAESGSRSIRQANASDVRQGSQGTGQGVSSTGPLEGQARQRFIRDRYERTQLTKERLEPKRRGVIFEVAPDPNNATLTDLWRTLDPAQRLAVSDRVARVVVPRVLAEFNTDGILAEQVGSYLDDTNPSFSLLLNKGDPVEIAKTLGFVLAQDSMMVVSPTEFKGGDRNAAIVIQVGDKTPKEIESIYNTLREIEVNGERPIGGQSYANGGMTVLNFSGVPTAQLAVLIDQKLNKAYSILTREVFAAFPDKQEYDYASSTNDGRGSRALLRQRARDLRSEATAVLEQELRAEGIEFSNRSDAASSGRDGGGVAEETREVIPSYGTPREGASSAIGYHYSRQQRSNLVSSAYGTGLKGAEMDRLRDADPALRSRIYFYIDRGTGINPEAGVGGFAHRVRLENLYDMDADTQRLARENRSANAFESAVMRAGFDGYMTRDAGPSGVAVLLGKHMVGVQQLGSQTRMKTEDIAPAAERALNAAEQIAANRSLPSGQMDGPSWARMVKAIMPDVYAQYENSPVWSTSQNMYKDGLARKLNESESAPAFSNRRQRLSTIGSRFTLPAPSMTDDARRALQDDALRMKRVVDAVSEQGGTVTEAQNFYDANTLMPGRIQAAMDDFKSQIVQPMIDKAVSYDIDLDELALYAYAKHAEERNNYIASINPRMPDGGSGMKTADANTILQQVQSGPKAQQYEELHRDLMTIASTTRQIMLSEGLITQDEFLSLDGAYANYIPLRGLENVDDEGRIRPGVGRGFNIRGKETIRALGRRSRASDLIENVLRDYERVVMRVEKNDAGKVLLDFVLSNPDPDLWDVDVERSKPSFNKTTGLVQYTKQIEKGEDTIGVKVGGQQVYIKLADTDLARAIRQSWKDEVSGFERAVVAMSGWWNNWMRNMLTRYNPAFAAINIPRDALWSGTTAALAELGAKGLASYLANYPQALLQSSKSELGGQTSTRYQEFRNSGGITGGFYMRGLEDIQKDLRNEMLAAGAKPRGAIERIKAARTYKLARLTLKALEFLGAASENATRFALFSAARDVGRTPVQAALLAKNGTTNFNRKGEWGGALNNLYLFYNAAVQGTTQLVRVLRSPAVVSAMAGVAGIGAMLAFYGASAGGEDDDGEAYWDKIPGYVKERNMVIMLPPGEPLADGIQRVGKRGRYFTVPVQFGFNIFPNLGYVIADTVRNQQDPKRGLTPTKAALHMTSVTFGSINPFGGAVDVTDGVQVLMAVMPTLADLPIQLATERGTFGTPSAPTKSAFDKKPDSERMFTSQQGTVPAKIAQALNEMTGGNEAKEGALSVTPGTIQTLISATTGGLGSFIEQVGSSILAMSGDDKDIKAAKIPFLNKFYGEVDETANIRAAGDRAREIKKVAEEVKEQARVGLEPKLDDDEKRLLNLASVADAYNQAISQMRKQEIQIIRDPKMTDAQKNLERRQIQVERDKLATEVNREYLNSLGAKR